MYSQSDIIKTLTTPDIIPFQKQITDIDFTTEKNAIRFTWRDHQFRISAHGGVEEVEESTKHLKGSELSILMEHILKRALSLHKPCQIHKECTFFLKMYCEETPERFFCHC